MLYLTLLAASQTSAGTVLPCSWLQLKHTGAWATLTGKNNAGLSSTLTEITGIDLSDSSLSHDFSGNGVYFCSLRPKSNSS
jgi:hypothetical protein